MARKLAGYGPGGKPIYSGEKEEIPEPEAPKKSKKKSIAKKIKDAVTGDSDGEET